MNKKAFTLSEALITLVIIGIITAITVPIALVNIDRTQYGTAAKKAVQSLNDTISLNITSGKKSPYTTNLSLYNYLAQNLGVVRKIETGSANASFYTKDGLRIEVPSKTPVIRGNDLYSTSRDNTKCGSSGLNIGGNTGNSPCFILVDTDGDKGPHNINSATKAKKGVPYIEDVIGVIITDHSAIPFGYAAQKAVYGE